MRHLTIVLTVLCLLAPDSALADAGSEPVAAPAAGSAAPPPSEPAPSWATDEEPAATAPAPTAAVGGAAPPAAPPSIEENPSGFMADAYRAATSKRWGLLAGFVLLALVWLARHSAIRVVPWFATTSGGVALAFGVSICGTLGLAMSAGAPITGGLFLSAATTAATAAGLWQWVSKRFPATSERIDEAKEAAKAGKPSA